MKRDLDLTNGNVLSVLWKFTVPILFSILLQTAYGTADLVIVSWFSGVADVSGVTIGSQIMQTVTAAYIGLAMGTTVLLGRFIGAGESERASKIIGVSIALFAVLAIVTTALLILLREYIAVAMQTPEESMTQTMNYLLITGAGTVFIVFYNLIASVFRGIGDSKTPLVTVAIACVINIVLDFIFVGGFNMGSSGAAFATIIAQGGSVVASFLMLRKRKLAFTIRAKDIRLEMPTAKRLIGLGLPIAMQGILVNLSFLFITAIINNFGVTASAAVGIVSKISVLIMILPQGFAQALAAFTAQNIGAKKIERAKKALCWSISISLVFGVITAYISAFHGEIFTRIFNNDADITGSALQYLKSYSIDCILVAFMFSFNGYFNGCGKTKFVMLESVGCAFLIRIPLSYLFSLMENTSLFYIGLATPASTFVQIFLCLIFYRHLNKEIKNSKL
ncbi:MAG: MATE family efflux transporter [Bacillota bacterium]